MSSPKVSVVIAGYEAEHFIGRAVRSALWQTLADIEVIVVDDASKDRTILAAEAAAGGDPRLKTIRLERNGGPSAARNAGFGAATGEWVAVLDADDEMAPARLERLVAYAEQQKADVVADALVVIEEGCEEGPWKVFRCGLGEPITLEAFALDNRMFHSSGGSGYLKPMFRRDFVTAHGMAYDQSLRICEDWMFVAEALAYGAKYVLFDQPLYRYTVRSGSTSARLSRDILKRLLHASEAFSLHHKRRLPQESREAVAARYRSIENALAFQTCVDRLKAGQPFRAISALLKHPGAAPLMRMPIEARLRGTRGARNTFS
jgi:succinoglycan biosynthesis protein ExoO